MESDEETNFTTQWVRADMVLYIGGHGNTQKENSNQTGAREGFLEVSVVCLSIYVSICQSFHLSLHGSVPISICLIHLCPFVCLLHIHRQIICLFLCQFEESVYCLTADLLVIYLCESCCLLVGLSTHVISSVLHYLSTDLSVDWCSNQDTFGFK